MKLSFLGATGTVTGSKSLLQLGSKNVLIDCGLFQGYKELRLRNWDRLPVKPESIDAVILTHAHIDHTGYLPLLAKNGFKGPIYATQATKALCSIMLPDSGHIQEEDANLANRFGFSKHKPALPLYTQEEAENVLEQFQPLAFDKKHPLFEDSYFSFSKAGHIQGSAFVTINHRNTSIAFSGDIGRPFDPVMCEPAMIESVDYLVLESTYGNRLHQKEAPDLQLARVIKETAKRGGTLIIPSFAVGRTQSLLYYIHMLKSKRAIPDIPVFVDSPMATHATKIFCQYADELRLSKNQCTDVCNVATYVQSVEESKALDSQRMPMIIISASGMATGGRVLHHLKAFAPDSRNTILFSGYQAGGTRGARIMHGEREIKIHGQLVPVRAQVEMIDNMSAHADYHEILQWLGHFKTAPKKVFINHGEQDAALALKAKIEQTLHWQCLIPEYLQTVNL